MPVSGGRFLSASLLLVSAAIWSSNLCLFAQDSGLELHANSKATASDIGLPAYPGAKPYQDKDNDGAVDMGFSFGDSHFRLLAANYTTSAAPDQVLSFYRKPLSKYGEVLECNDGKPVGKLTHTSTGLTCSDKQSGNVEVNGTSSSKDHELRAGNPQQYRVVGIDKVEPSSTRFGLVYIEVPKDAANAKSK